ncbi:helix-turn-helix transcriptional regulator [Streptomyces sp. NPDC023838]|uniref:helix-turn-helix transcriptional regulator n=1 Tax=Streptomyces sp. NPDC023838 TaxID=3154325 RepID=UPI0034079D6B
MSSLRSFNGRRLRTARRAAEQRQQDLGDALGVSKVAVADWESGKATPPPERLPAIARALGQSVDVLFERIGPPDLAGLRADAEYSQTQAAKALGISRVPLGNAEGGKRRLAVDIAERAAALYGVSLAELEAAQDVSFGIMPANRLVAGRPASGTVGEKLRALLRTRPMSDEELAAAINRKAQAEIVAPAVIEALRTEQQSAEEILAGLPLGTVYEGLADALGVPPFHFQTGEQVEREIMERLRFLAQGLGEGRVTINARGGGGISEEMLAVAAELVMREMRANDAPDGQ